MNYYIYKNSIEAMDRDLSLTNSSDIRFTTNVTGVRYLLVGKGLDWDPSIEWSLFYDEQLSASKLYFECHDTVNNVDRYLALEVGFTIGVAYRLTTTYDGVSSMKLYINNVLQNATYTAHTQYVCMRNTGHNVLIGSYISTSYFNGTIDYCTIYNRVLTQDEITNGICNVYELKVGDSYLGAKLRI